MANAAAQTDDRQAGSMRRGLTALVIGLLAVVAFAFAAEPPAVEWTKTFTGKGMAGGTDARQTADGGYIVAGATSDTSGYDIGHYYLVKTDQNGNVQWQVIDSSNNRSSDGTSVIQTADGSYVVAGFGGSAPNVGAQLMKFDANGHRQWQKIVADSFGHRGYVVLEANNGYALSTWHAASDSGVELIFTDTAGDRLWKRRYAIYYELLPAPRYFPLQQTSDNGFVIGATALIRTDSLGNQKWLKTFAGVEVIYSVIQTPDKGFVATGGTADSSHQTEHIFLLRTDSLGNLKWLRKYGSSDSSSVGFGLARTSDGDYLIAGHSYAAGEPYVLRTDSLGNKLSDMSPGGMCGVGGLHRTADNGYVLTGPYNDGTVGAQTLMRLIKLSPEQTGKR
jgi:hypothetical protein